ncbi:uncharacterized protein BJ212DRAFT_1367081 [Suillus subaureus]|uniref:Uncharacterized protein n=1 Tax=Suillus subaureus TaxID=48587 RepID=A0A9P7JBS4_9AGAM|nr:uncharacterized protein BJ212DRAFT_1367081 [Suillus subaureus]KAG1813190.1 hypothetical protein BJ212DRAFT_1367081 [Suillus subaureus]
MAQKANIGQRLPVFQIRRFFSPGYDRHYRARVFIFSTSTTVVAGIRVMYEAAMSLPISKFVWLPVILSCVYSPGLMSYAYSVDIKEET